MLSSTYAYIRSPLIGNVDVSMPNEAASTEAGIVCQENAAAGIRKLLFEEECPPYRGLKPYGFASAGSYGLFPQLSQQHLQTNADGHKRLTMQGSPSIKDIGAKPST